MNGSFKHDGPMLIGLSGKAEAGKTESAQVIKTWVEESHGGRCDVIEISAMILAECVDLGLLPVGSFRNPQDKEQNKVLIDHGSARREANPMYWTDKFLAFAATSTADVVVCPNVRMSQEADAIVDARGTVWRVNRLNKNGTPFVSPTRDPKHITECALDAYDRFSFVITNVDGHPALLREVIITHFEYAAGLYE